MNYLGNQDIIRYAKGKWQGYDLDLIDEEPLLIRVEGRSYSVVMRTPGDEIAHGAGFCLAEGLVDQPEDIATIGFCSEMDSNVLTVALSPERREKVGDLLNRRGFISQTSCGVCGKELLKDIYQILKPISDQCGLTVEQAKECVQQLSNHQHLMRRTWSSHGAMLFDICLTPLAVAEDVGRHNALDKAIGKAFMDRKLRQAKIAVVSSRLSYELVQKAARAELAVLIGMSRPTALAVEMGRALNMTLACFSKSKELAIYCGKERFSDSFTGIKIQKLPSSLFNLSEIIKPIDGNRQQSGRTIL